MDKKTLNFFKRSIASIVIVCIVVFVGLNTFMSHKTEASIEEIGNIYMSEMHNQIRQRFKLITDLRLSQVDKIINLVPPEDADYGDEMLSELQRYGKAEGFTYLGLYGENGEIQVIYGEDAHILNDDYTMQSFNEDDHLLAQAQTADEDNILILGVKAAYPMNDGDTSFALIAGLPMEYLNEVLFSDEDTHAYYHIINTDGNFVIRNYDSYTVKHYSQDIDSGYDSTDEDYEKKTQEFYEAVKTGSIFTTTVTLRGYENKVYCSPMPRNSTWYLVSAMNISFLTESVTELDETRRWITVISVVAILSVISVIFVLYYRMSQRQITELAKARKEAVRANMAKSDFLASMSHDIRTPMNAIIGMTEIGLKNSTDSERMADCLRKIGLSSRHLLGLINDILDMSKIESGKMVLSVEPVSLRDSIEEIANVIQPQLKEKKQNFDIYIHDIFSEDVCCDSVRLNQVLQNLLSNAVKFTPENGRVDVSVYQEKLPMKSDFIRTHFIVTDTGIGMSQQFQQKIWDTFAREETDTVRHIVGSGLGTSISKRIVDLMGGTIEIESEQGKGSSFHVTVDLQLPNVSENADKEEMKLPAWNILIMDENEKLCESAVSCLEELGTHAEYTPDGKEAVQMIESHHNMNDDYHFVLIDRKMPGMNGMETIREIREHVNKEIPVFLITAYDPDDMESEVDTGLIGGFISKPLFKSTLYQRLKQYIDGFNDEKEQEDIRYEDFNGRCILLAEDIDINWEVASEILSITGMKLERAVNGKECLDMFEKSEIGYYDAILMDIRMPIMNGYDAAMAIRALERTDKNLPIIAMTADAFSDDAQHCLECGMNAHIPKPIDVKECMRILHKYLES